MNTVCSSQLPIGNETRDFARCPSPGPRLPSSCHHFLLSPGTSPLPKPSPWAPSSFSKSQGGTREGWRTWKLGGTSDAGSEAVRCLRPLLTGGTSGWGPCWQVPTPRNASSPRGDFSLKALETILYFLILFIDF